MNGTYGAVPVLTLSPVEIRNIARSTQTCVICRARRRQPCAGTTGVHLARVAGAARDPSLIPPGDFASVIPDGDLFAGEQIVLAGAL